MRLPIAIDGNRISKRALIDGANSFEVTVLEAAEPSHIVLFSVGGGGIRSAISLS